TVTISHVGSLEADLVAGGIAGTTSIRGTIAGLTLAGGWSASNGSASASTGSGASVSGGPDPSHFRNTCNLSAGPDITYDISGVIRAMHNAYPNNNLLVRAHVYPPPYSDAVFGVLSGAFAGVVVQQNYSQGAVLNGTTYNGPSVQTYSPVRLSLDALGLVNTGE